MRKRLRKLTLRRETLQALTAVSGGLPNRPISGESVCEETCVRVCQPVPSIGGCGSNLFACASNGATGCQSGIC
jgi:hypothetical protein